MDEVFSIFLDTFGSAVDRESVPASSIERYRNKLPDRLLEYWAEQGWGGYGNGIFWLVNPEVYEPVVSAWLEGTELGTRDNYHIFARGAFGDLYLWGERTGHSLKITSVFSRCVVQEFEIQRSEMDRAIEDFIVSRSPESNDLEGLFKPATKKLGRLNCDEMFGFVPAFMLGGDIVLSNVRKVKAVEHLVFLAQLDELMPYSF